MDLLFLWLTVSQRWEQIHNNEEELFMASPVLAGGFVAGGMQFFKGAGRKASAWAKRARVRDRKKFQSLKRAIRVRQELAETYGVGGPSRFDQR